MEKMNRIVITVIFALGLIFIAAAAFAQDQDVNPYGGIYYNDHANQRFYGRFALPRTDNTNLDTLTNLIKGSLVFDTLENQLEYVDTNFNWIGVNEGNTLDEAYDQGGAGAGREIEAVDGAVWVSGEDGFIVTGSFGSGDTSQWVGAGTGMFFEPNKAAFRAGFVTGTQWNDNNIGLGSIAIGSSTESSGLYSSSFGSATSASGVSSLATGNSTTAESYAETAIGLYNTDYTPTSTSAWEATDRLFVIGNGQDSGTRSDALVMLKDGSTTLNGSLAIVDGTEANDNTEFIVGEKTFTFGGVAPVTINGTYISSEFGVTGDTTANLYFGGVNFGGQDQSGIRLGFNDIPNGIIGASLAVDKSGVIRLEGSQAPLVGGTRTRLDVGNSIGVHIHLEGNEDNTFLVADTLENTMFQVDKDGTTINDALEYVDGNEADGYVLTSDADGNATWTHTFSYGEMGFGDSTSTIALTLNKPAWVTNGNNDLWSEGAKTLEGITYSNDSLICNADGVYEVNLRISGDLALNDVLKVGIYKNGSLSCTCQGQITSPLLGTVEITYVDILPLSADDVLQVYITNTANSNDFDAISAKMTMHKVGN